MKGLKTKKKEITIQTQWKLNYEFFKVNIKLYLN